MRKMNLLFAWQSTQGLIWDQRPHCAKLLISKIVDISFSHLYVFSTSAEFLDNMQEPFGEVLLWVLDPPYLEPGEDDLEEENSKSSC